MFDYEWAIVQHTVNCSLAQAVVVPDADPARSACAATGPAARSSAYAGLKEEYYLADFEPDPAVLGALGLDPGQPLIVVRTPPEVSLYHRFENDLFGARAAPSAGQPRRWSCPGRPSSRPSCRRPGA